MGMRKGWHRVIVRFGPNTTRDFMADSEPGVVLGERDIFFLDIGPLADADIRPNPNLCLLEMAIRYPTRKFGAFYEDLPLEDQSFAS
jgi:hypothetical protein